MVFCNHFHLPSGMDFCLYRVIYTQNDIVLEECTFWYFVLNIFYKAAQSQMSTTEVTVNVLCQISIFLSRRSKINKFIQSRLILAFMLFLIIISV